MTMNGEHLRRAVALAVENIRAGQGGPFGAVIVKDGVIVGEGANSVTTTLDPTAHGEVNAIRAACRALGSFSLAGCEIYTSCEPCPMCLAAIYWARIERIYYGASQRDAARAGFDDAFLYEEFRRGPQERRIAATQLLREESQEPFETWGTLAGRVEY